MNMDDIQILQSSIVLRKINEAKSIIASIRKNFSQHFAPEVLPNIPELNLKVQNIKSGLVESNMWLIQMLTLLESPIEPPKIIDFKLEELNSKEKLSFYSEKLESLLNDRTLMGVLFHKNIKSLELANNAFYIKLCETKNWINYLKNNE